MAKRPSLIIAVILGIIALLIGVFILSRKSDEPTYAGKSLREWLQLYFSRTRTMTTPDDAESAEAIRHIGTNALPFLVYWLQEYRDLPRWRDNVYGVVEGIAGIDTTIKFASVLDSGLVNGILADHGFRVLGGQARSAIPELIRLMGDTSRPELTFRATMAIVHIGEEAIPALLAVATNSAPPTQTTALNGLQMMGTNAQSAIPTVLTLLSNRKCQCAIGCDKLPQENRPSTLTNRAGS